MAPSIKFKRQAEPILPELNATTLKPPDQPIPSTTVNTQQNIGDASTTLEAIQKGKFYYFYINNI